MKAKELIEKLPINLRRAVAVFLILLVTLISLIPIQYIPPKTGLFNIDKLIHVIMYLSLSLSVMGAYKNIKPDFKWIYPAIIIIAFGLLMEVLQEILPIGRQFSWYDLFANAIGCVLGIFLYLKIILI